MILYEWVVEEIDEHSDIVDVNHFDNLKDARQLEAFLQKTGAPVDVGLVRFNFSIDGAHLDKGWAYFTDGKLPVVFDNGEKVPKKYIAESVKTPTEV